MMPKTDWRRVAAPAALFLAASCVVVVWIMLAVPDPQRYPVRGIDVSHHQGKIDWDALTGEKLSFAYIKASEGADFRDERFSENLRGAAAAGIPAGGYHFFTFCRPGAVQAENFLGALEGAPAGLLPPVIDLEFQGNCRERPSAQALREELSDFTAVVERRLGSAPVFYVTTEFLNAYGDAMPAKGEIWIRSVFFHPDRTFRRPWVFWQFAGEGTVKGIEGPVDLDVFNGSAVEWKAYIERRRCR